MLKIYRPTHFVLVGDGDGIVWPVACSFSWMIFRARAGLLHSLERWARCTCLSAGCARCARSSAHSALEMSHATEDALLVDVRASRCVDHFRLMVCFDVEIVAKLKLLHHKSCDKTEVGAEAEL